MGVEKKQGNLYTTGVEDTEDCRTACGRRLKKCSYLFFKKISVTTGASRSKLGAPHHCCPVSPFLLEFKSVVQLGKRTHFAQPYVFVYE